jgi:hypothetical protein
VKAKGYKMPATSNPSSDKLTVADVLQRPYADPALIAHAVDLFKDAKRGKNKHFNAASRYEMRALFMENGATLLSGMLTALLAVKAVGAVPENFPHIFLSPWFAVLISMASTGLVMFQAVKKYYQEARTHRDIGNQFIFETRNIEKLISDYVSEIIDGKAFSSRLETLTSAYSKINEQAETHPTSDADFKHALMQEGEGDEHIIEMLLLGPKGKSPDSNRLT